MLPPFFVEHGGKKILTEGEHHRSLAGHCLQTMLAGKREDWQFRLDREDQQL